MIFHLLAPLMITHVSRGYRRQNYTVMQEHILIAQRVMKALVRVHTHSVHPRALYCAGARLAQLTSNEVLPNITVLKPVSAAISSSTKHVGHLCNNK